jgi:arylsulfatase A-like enzyme
VSLLSALGCGGSALAGQLGAQGRAKPNIIFIVADDLDVESASHMPKLQAFMAGMGATFGNSFASNPVCCPSRVAMLRGQYSHNSRVWANGRGNNSCFSEFRSLGHESSTVATWLKAAGYRTSLVGKYLNRYPVLPGGIVDEAHIPAGWDDWFVVWNAEFNSDSYFDYMANDNGRRVTFGRSEADYETDVVGTRATDFIKKNVGQAPLFLWVATTAPHAPHEPARRHLYAHADKRAPRSPNFNEADIGDKPRWYRDHLPLLTPNDIADLDGVYKRRVETLQAVDDLLERLLLALDAAGQLGNTYVFFTSDNGYMSGNHRFPSGKDAPYEESIRVPLFVRGPGVPAGVKLSHDVSNIDIAPTLAELGQAQAPGFIDGRSLVPLLTSAPTPLSGWRQDLLLEHEPADPAGLPAWFALRTGREKYVEYPANAEEEYYDLVNDPYETESRHRALDAAKRTQFRARINQLRECAGATCRQ